MIHGGCSRNSLSPQVCAQLACSVADPFGPGRDEPRDMRNDREDHVMNRLLLSAVVAVVAIPVQVLGALSIPALRM